MTQNTDYKYTVLIPYLSTINGVPNRCIDMCKEYLYKNSTYPFELLEAVDYPDYYLAVNDNFMKASTDIVILFNDDMFVEPGWDELYVKHTKPKSVVSGYLVESGRIEVGGGAIEFDCGREPENFDYNKFIEFSKSYKEANNIPESLPILGHAAPCALHKDSWIPFEIIPGMLNNSSGVDGDYFFNVLPNAGFTYNKINSFVYHIQSFTSKPN
jgi:hypothetical protein